MGDGHGISWWWWVLAWVGTAVAVWFIYRVLTGRK